MANSGLTRSLVDVVSLPTEAIDTDTPLAVNLWAANGQLLLRKGDTVTSEAQLAKLMEHKPVVRSSDLRNWNYQYNRKIDRWLKDNADIGVIAAVSRPSQVFEPGRYSGLLPSVEWPDLHHILSALLHQNAAIIDGLERFEGIDAKLVALMDNSPDDSLFMLGQMVADRTLAYSASNALLSSALCHLVAPLMGMSETATMALRRAALSMNLGMASLQDELAKQLHPPSPEQREVIHRHPIVGVSMLLDMGVDDAMWLSLVGDHHETTDGKGYPSGKTELTLAQQILHQADVYVASISPRKSRQGLPPQRAIRAIYLNSDAQHNDIGAAFIRALGIYPPGTYVKLASNEIGVVVRRGRRANLPTVYAIVNKQGIPLATPALRDVEDKLFEIKGSVSPADVKVVINPAKLLSRV